ncbi:MAG TPA: protein tyrosine phosphatase family protein [Gemmatimonadales bacterium]|nr:protein tyrosine phosphatase family protein [Gemmatimonadales bacterium]
MPTLYQAIAGVVNACQVLPNLVTGGQPGEAQLSALQAAGCEVILDVRSPGERRGFDEPGLVRALGMEYVNIPIGEGPLTDELLERVLAILRLHGDQRIFFHCASGNRVGGPLIPYLMLDHTLSEEDAVGVAMRVGLRSPELLQWGLTYARRHERI